jgi:hypothetical protein
VKEALEEAQKSGQPPLAPRTRGIDGDAQLYDILVSGTKSRVSYRWVRLSPIELRTLNLDIGARDDRKREQVWHDAAISRGKATTLTMPGGRPILQGAVFYSRERKDPNVPEEEMARMPIEYFVLARNPEIDPTTGRETPIIDGTYLVSAFKTNPFAPEIENRKTFELLGLAALAVVGFALLFVRRWLHLSAMFLVGIFATLAAAAIFVILR